MRLELTCRHIDITPALRRLVDAKLVKLDRLLNDSAVSAQAVLTREKYRMRTEITVHARGEKFLHGVGNATAWETSLTQAIDKIAQQAATVKGKWQERKRRGPQRPSKAEIPAPAVPAAAGRRAAAPKAARPERPRMPPILRSARQAVKPMSVADAVRQLEAQGEDVLVFQDLDRESVSVLYRRQSGELTLVETEQ